MVSQVVDTMGVDQRLGRKIVDIIGVIDGIAFQTNILALNAAVEAARAGEQGRGFAVVASEVRNLAQRSAAAAKEIKTLIGDSVEKVERGSKLVGQAGATMDEVVASVKRVTDIMSEIATASQEQSAGIEQVNQAIIQMDAGDAAERRAGGGGRGRRAEHAGPGRRTGAAWSACSASAGANSQRRRCVQYGRPPPMKPVASHAKPALAPRRAAPAQVKKFAAAQPVAAGASDWEEF